MMILNRSAALWSLFFILGFACSEARSGITDEEIEDLLIQAQHQRSQSRPNLRRRDETDYVTQKQFDDTVDSLNSTMNIMNNKMNSMASDLTDLKQKYTDLDTAVANDVTKDDFNKAGGSWQGQINEVAENLSKLDKNVNAMQSNLDKDHCADSPCVNEAQCLNRLNGYECVCRSGYGGVNCQNVEGWGLTAILSVDNGGKWGDWELVAMCKPGSYTYEFHVQMEDVVGSGYDDSCMNNIELMCWDAVEGKDTGTIRSGTGPFGDWKDWQKCGSGGYLTGFKLKVEEGQGPSKDDTAVNGITMICTDEKEYTGPISEYGTFGSTAMCPEGDVICGVATKIEAAQGRGDDTALNDIRMICCSMW